MKNKKIAWVGLMVCMAAISYSMCSYSMMTTKLLVRTHDSENPVRSLASCHIEKLLQQHVIRANSYSLKSMHPIVLSDYYARILPHHFERFILDISTMAQRATRRLQHPAWYVLVTKDTHDARTTIQKLSTQSGVDYLSVNPVYDLSNCGKEEINQLFSGLCTEAKKTGRPAVLFIEEADFLLNNSREIVPGVDVPALLYAIANHRDGEHLTIVIHIRSSQNISKSRERYLDCSWLFLSLIDLDVRRKMAVELFDQHEVTIDDEGLDLLAARTEGYTVTEVRDVITQITAWCTCIDNQSVRVEDIRKYFSQVVRPKKWNDLRAKLLNLHASYYVALVGGTCYVSVLGIIGVKYVLNKVAEKKKKNNIKSMRCGKLNNHAVR